MTPTVAELLAGARQRIPAAEARLLLGHLLGKTAAWLEAHRDDGVDVDREYAALIERRAAGEPIAYLTGMREFYGRDFVVTPAVLIPRPETELLVDIAKSKVSPGGTAHLVPPTPSPALAGGETSRAHGAMQILDLGAGSGCLAITLALELPHTRVTAVDNSTAALAVAHANATRLGAAVTFVESDWFAALAPERFDLIVANPPYVAAGDPHLAQGDLRFEPFGALTDQADGLSAIRRIVAAAPSWLVPGGWLILEHGYDQAADVREVLDAAGFVDLEQHRDLAGIVRASGGRLRGAND